MGVESGDKANRTKPVSVFRWRGLMADYKLGLRVVVALVLVTACASLAFTQLGFLGIGTTGEYRAYAVVILVPVALCAILLGTWRAALLGMFTGGIMYAHAVLMPLDYYELAFVTPVTSVLMLTITGLLFGIFFAAALRRNPNRWRRVVRIILISVIVSWIYSISFVVNAFFETMKDLMSLGIAEMSEEELLELGRSYAVSLVFRLGDVGLQGWVDAGLIAVFCIGADFVVGYASRRVGHLSLHRQFAIWLAVVVAVAFMLTSAVGFGAITQGEIADAESSMRDQNAYLCNQLDRASQRDSALSGLLEQQNIDIQSLPEKLISDLMNAISTDVFLKGFTKEKNGIVIIGVDLGEVSFSEGNAMGESDAGASAAAQNPSTETADASNNADDESFMLETVFYIVNSDDDRYGANTDLGNLVDSDVITSIRKSRDNGTMERIVYDESHGKKLEELAKEENASSEIAYLCASQSQDGYTVITIYPASKVFEGRSAVMMWTAISMVVLLMAVFAMVSLLLHRLVVRRIDETNEVLGRITDGDLDARVEVHNPNEFESLSSGINDTVGALKGWIAEAESRIDAELATAKEIQESALPRTFPPFPDITKFDIYASMNAARKVGGDFYDFFLVGDEASSEEGKLGFVIADVSGKGVPAALFMMKAKTQIRDYLVSGMEIGEAIENANRQLCDGNDAGMFVTAWVGVLDYESGHIEYVNAGHNPPLLWQKSTGWKWITEKSGLPLGLFDGFPYDAYSFDCQIGDELLLYTDGVTEAMDVNGQLYGEDRLMTLAEECYTMHPRMLVDSVRQDVAAHANGAEQSDDITILALEVGVPPEMTATLIVPADVDELPRVNDFIHTELDHRLCPVRAQKQIDIAVEELFVNVAHYAYPDATPDAPGVVRVSYTYSADPPSVRIDIADEGIPYNPLAKPDAVTPDDIMEVPIGGLGILMAKKSVDEMTYEYLDGSNIVTIKKKW